MWSDARPTETGETLRIIASADDERFRAFYATEHDRMVRRAVLLTGSVDVAHDVVHDAFTEVWRRWRTITDHGPYLHRAVVNGARDHHRRGARTERLLDRLRPAGVTEAVDHDPTLTRALAALPFQQRAAVVLRYYGGLSEREIATQLDCPTGSVGPWIRRGLDRLQQELA